MTSKIIKLFGILFTADKLWLGALRYGVAAGVEHKSVLRHLELQAIVDIGANRGQFALVCRKLFPQGRIDSFEPLEKPAARFRRVFAGDARTNLYQYAIGPKEEDAVIHVSKRDDSSSLLPISKLQSTLFPHTEEYATQTVHVCPLERLISKSDIERPALLKLDVQGYELAALRGCQALLPCFEHVYVECSFVELYEGQALAHEVIDFLRQEGFALNGVYNMCYGQGGVAIQADFLFKRMGWKDGKDSCVS